jgi:hypothetical protein
MPYAHMYSRVAYFLTASSLLRYIPAYMHTMFASPYFFFLHVHGLRVMLYLPQIMFSPQMNRTIRCWVFSLAVLSCRLHMQTLRELLLLAQI